jgi:integrase
MLGLPWGLAVIVAAPAIDLSLASPDELRAEIERLRTDLRLALEQLRDERRKGLRLTSTVRDQARTTAALLDECPDGSPSVAIVYWKWSDARRSHPGWRLAWHRIVYLVSYFGALPAPLMTAAKWDEFRAWRKLQVTRLGAPPCDQTLNIELIYAKQMLTFAVDRGMIKRNPLLPAKRVATISQRETRLTPDDIDRLLAAADDVTDGRLAEGDDDGNRAAMLKAFLLCCFDSMMRFNEARHLRFDRIRSDGMVELLAAETKSKRRRIIRLTGRTLEAIERIRRVDGSEYVFARTAESLVSETALRAWFRRACEISGVDERATLRDKQVRPHDARAGGATTADEAGARPTAIQAALGHRSMDMTIRYLRSEPEENANPVADAMERATDSARRGPRRAPMKKKGTRT